MREHKHRDLLLAIQAAVDVCPPGPPLRLIKVLSHAGVVGNESAGVGPVAAASGHATSGVFPEHSSAWSHMSWPYMCTTQVARAACTCAYAPVDGLEAALKSWMASQHTLGTADAGAYYFCQ